VNKMIKEHRAQRILIVDDSVENIDILVSIFKDDYMVAAALNGQKALAMAQKTLPDLILLDIMMPEMDGYEVCARLKKNDATKNIPVIFVTASMETLDELKAFKMGAVDYITKPFQPVVVKTRVRTHLNLKEKNDMLEALASLDGLTNIYNRRKFDQTLTKEWKRALRNQEDLSLILIDIDHFKQFNDNYGHMNGDECLIKVARTLQSTINRPGDFLGRYGGEEFVVVLPGTDLKGGQAIAESFRQAIINLNIGHEYSKVAEYLTISIGVATIRPQKESTGPAALIEAADKMMYTSKENGRNQVNGVQL